MTWPNLLDNWCIAMGESELIAPAPPDFRNDPLVFAAVEEAARVNRADVEDVWRMADDIQKHFAPVTAAEMAEALSSLCCQGKAA